MSHDDEDPAGKLRVSACWRQISNSCLGPFWLRKPHTSMGVEVPMNHVSLNAN